MAYFSRRGGAPVARRQRAHPVPTSHAALRRSATQGRSPYDRIPLCGAVCYAEDLEGPPAQAWSSSAQPL